jgi:hypothetical protein
MGMGSLSMEDVWLAVFANLFALVTANSFAEYTQECEKTARFDYSANEFAVTGANEFANTSQLNIFITHKGKSENWHCISATKN